MSKLNGTQDIYDDNMNFKNVANRYTSNQKAQEADAQVDGNKAL
jgi:hypothetical protein